MTRLIEGEERRLLHVGCGPRSQEKLPRYFRESGWQEVRLDIDVGCQPDIVANMTAMDAVANASISAIFSSHNLEHLYPHEVTLALKEFYRVLDDDGFVLITVPDLQSVAKLIARGNLEDVAYVSPAGPIAPLDMLYGHRASMARGNLYMAHRTGFTWKTLANAFLQAGFYQVAAQRDGRFGLWAIATKNKWHESRLDALRQRLLPLPARANDA